MEQQDISDRLDKLKDDSKKYAREYREFPVRKGKEFQTGNSSYCDIIGNRRMTIDYGSQIVPNLLQRVEAETDEFRKAKLKKDVMGMLYGAEIASKALQIYFRLLDEFPEFFEKEYKVYAPGKNAERCFPNIDAKSKQSKDNAMSSPQVYYVFESAKRLRQIAQPK